MGAARRLFDSDSLNKSEMSEQSLTIKSMQNPSLQLVRKLQRSCNRKELGLFIAEGEDLLAAADAAGWQPKVRLAAVESGLPGQLVRQALLNRCSTLGSGTRTLAVYEQRQAIPVGPLSIYLHGVHDPGNVGAILRSALAFGVDSVVLSADSADPYAPKAVRASMGAIFALPPARVALTAATSELSMIKATFAALPGQKIALVAGAGEALAGPLSGSTTLVVGGERAGLSTTLVECCDYVAHIPIAVESLNVAMAATVALYEATRSS